MSEFNKTTTIGIVFSTNFLIVCHMTYNYEIRKQHSQEFEHWFTIIQETRAHWVDETWDGLAIDIPYFIISIWEFISSSIWFVIFYDIM